MSPLSMNNNPSKWLVERKVIQMEKKYQNHLNVI